MISVLEKDAEIYADITFGQKPIPMLLICVLTFAEKFFNAYIKNYDPHIPEHIRITLPPTLRVEIQGRKNFRRKECNRKN